MGRQKGLEERQGSERQEMKQDRRGGGEHGASESKRGQGTASISAGVGVQGYPVGSGAGGRRQVLSVGSRAQEGREIKRRRPRSSSVKTKRVSDESPRRWNRGS